MRESFALKFYKSPAWLRTRKNYLNKTLETPTGICPPGMCERCFERGDLVPAKVVHHKKHLTPENINDPKVTLAYDNLQRLCQDCHAEVHSTRVPNRVTFNADGTIAGPSAADSFEVRLQRLTEDTESADRNIYKRSDRR